MALFDRHKVPPSIFEDAVNNSFNSERSDSENAASTYDRLSQFGLPTDRDQANDLLLDIEDEIRRKRNSGF